MGVEQSISGTAGSHPPTAASDTAPKGYVLVVDDDPTALALGSSLLRRQGSFTVKTAASAEIALELAAECVPLAVVTDWQMPGMDGLQLVREIRRLYADVPCIVATAHGSEESAVQALEAGASSYVPKNKLVPQLTRTLVSVLAVRAERIKLNRIRNFLTKSRDEYVLPTDRELVTPLITAIQDKLAAADVCAPEDLTRIGVALTEALLNAMIHGNLSVSSKLLDGQPQAFEQEIARKMADSAYGSRRVFVNVGIDAHAATVTIRDEGAGFDVNKVADPTEETGLELSHGRGLLLMRAFMDEVVYNEPGNQVTLTKRRTVAAAVPAMATADSQAA